MSTDDDSQAPDSRWDDIETDRRAVEAHLRPVMRDIQLAPPSTTEANQLATEAGRLRKEQQRLTDEAGLNGLSAETLPHALAGNEREMERRRIALQILAVVVPWRDALCDLDVEECNLFRVRGHALLNYLDAAVMPYPDLQDALAAARSELAGKRPTTGSRHLPLRLEPLSTLELLEALPHDGVALAGDALQTGPIVDGHQATSIADETEPP